MLVAFVGAVAATALAVTRVASDATVSVADPVGDAVNEGADVVLLTATVSGDALTLTAKTNAQSYAPAQSIQFFIHRVGQANSADIAYFDGADTELSIWNGSAYQTYREVDGGWDSTGTIFTTSVSLSELQSALAFPVLPELDVSVETFVSAYPGVTPQRADTAPNTGDLVVPTSPPAATTTQALPTTTALVSVPKTTKPEARPRFSQATKVVGNRLEWTRLAVQGVPALDTVEIDCVAGCSLTESPRVVRGTATSKDFLRHPFAGGTAFVTSVTGPDGTGWWFRTTVAKGARPTATQAHGCISSSGVLGAC